MQRCLRITIEKLNLVAELAQTPSAEALWDALPLSAQAHRWGDELYFSVPFSAPLESDAQEVVQAGDVAYWPDGPTLCFFFGPTPVSRPNEIRAAAAVNICGRIKDESSVLRQVTDTATITLNREET
jgi:hypothetical protein